MALVDSLDGLLMLWAYGWVCTLSPTLLNEVPPIQALIDGDMKLLFNFAVTLASAVVALLVATVELLAFIDSYLHPKGDLWSVVRALNDHFS